MLPPARLLWGFCSEEVGKKKGLEAGRHTRYGSRKEVSKSLFMISVSSYRSTKQKKSLRASTRSLFVSGKILSITMFINDSVDNTGACPSGTFSTWKMVSRKKNKRLLILIYHQPSNCYLKKKQPAINCMSLPTKKRGAETNSAGSAATTSPHDSPAAKIGETQQAHWAFDQACGQVTWMWGWWGRIGCGVIWIYHHAGWNQGLLVIFVSWFL